MSQSAIAVIIPTYNRPQIVGETIRRLQHYLRYDGAIDYFSSDDSTDDRMPETRAQIENLPRLSYVRGPHRGLGANLNALLRRSADYDLLLQMDDDHQLNQLLDLNEHARKLLEDESAGWIRLMGIGFHRYIADLNGHYWRVRWNSPELYIPSNRPHLKHRRYHEHYGMYPEGLTLGQTEEIFCHQCIDRGRRSDGPAVLVPLNSMSETAWEHVGDSWQAKGF